MKREISWGILGCGRIAHTFSKSLAQAGNGRITACASRTPGKAAAFAAHHGIERAYEDYRALVGNPSIDAVYIANTHNFHHDDILLALTHGKAVLCEKPLAVSGEQAASAVAMARQQGCFLMEAMWTRFLPAVRRMKGLIDDGVIGDVMTIRADFCVMARHDPEGRLFNPRLAGGALLDLGIYPVSMASFIMGGQPANMAVHAVMGDTGVDEQVTCLFDYGGGRTAMLSCSLRAPSRNRLEVCGTGGVMVLPETFWAAQAVEWTPRSGTMQRLSLPFPEGCGFMYEIEEVHASLAAGRRESALMPLDETVAIARTMDRIASHFPPERIAQA